MSAPDTQAAVAGTACYVYGIVPADTTLPPDLGGIGDPPARLTASSNGRVAAVVSAVDPERPLGTRRDLLAHEQVLDEIAVWGPVLPMRFGAVLTDQDAVSTELLAAHHDEFADSLDRLAGHAQFMLEGRYEHEVVLREVLAEEPEAMALREELEGVSEEAGYYDRIRLGTVVAGAIAIKREKDKDIVIDSLAPHTVSMAVHQPIGDEDAFEIAFLVPHEHQAGFEEAVETLGWRWSGRIRMSLLGPLAPYDFVAVSGQ